MITGHGDMDLAIEALNLDAADFVNKPIQRHTLNRALQRAKERIQLSQSQEHPINLELTENSAVIRIQGNVTSRSESQLRDAYEDALSSDKEKIVLSFADNASVNGAGIAILTQILIDAQKREHPVVIAGLSENFQSVFDISGISRLAMIVDTEEKALTS
mgnify:CR=1 FL=1